METPSHLADDVESPAHWMDPVRPGSLQPHPSTAKHSQVPPSTITYIQPDPSTAISLFPFAPRPASPEVAPRHHSVPVLVTFLAAESGLMRTELLLPASVPIPLGPFGPPHGEHGQWHGWRGKARYSHCFWPGAATDSRMLVGGEERSPIDGGRWEMVSPALSVQSDGIPPSIPIAYTQSYNDPMYP